MGRKRVTILSSLEDTLSVGKQIGSCLPPNSVLALRGDLGAGKTTLTQGIAMGLGIEAPIQSPTFVYLNPYDEGTFPLFHFDLYRMNGASDFKGLGFDEYFDKGGVCAIEWSERIEKLLPERTLVLTLSHHPEGRRLSIRGPFLEPLAPLCR